MKQIRLLVIILAITCIAGCGTPQNIEINLNAPIEVAQGEQFEIIVTVKNTAIQKQSLVSIDIGNRYLRGIAIQNTEPNFKEASYIPIDNTYSYVYGITLAPGEQITIKLQAYALKPGDYNSEIDFCINTDFDFLTRPVRTVVR